MPKTKKENKMEINSKGKELDELVSAIIIKCDETIAVWKNNPHNDRAYHFSKELFIQSWELIIDNLPIRFVLECRVTSERRYSDEYNLFLQGTLQWNGLLCLDNSDESHVFAIRSNKINVVNDVIDKNDITRNIIDIFNFSDMKYCKIRNVFGKKDNIFLNAVNYFDLKTMNGDECCVCYDKTITRTKQCNHYLCLQCVSKIKTFIPPNTPDYINCPMCKQRVNKMTTLRPDCDSGSDSE